jgi:hypothetical protein
MQNFSTSGSRRVLETSALEITCEDCGRSKLWTRSTLSSIATSRTTLDDLGARLFCSACRLRGGGGFNIRLRSERERVRAAGSDQRR